MNTANAAIYNPSEPLYHVSQVNSSTCETRMLEVGQAGSYSEAMFFLSIGYRVQESRWEGIWFAVYQNYYPEDLL